MVFRERSLQVYMILRIKADDALVVQGVVNGVDGKITHLVMGSDLV